MAHASHRNTLDKIRLPGIGSRRDGRRECLLVLAGLFAGQGRFFLLCSVAGFGLFLRGFLLCRFWGSIAHNSYLFLCWLTRLRHTNFSASSFIMLGRTRVVNAPVISGTGEDRLPPSQIHRSSALIRLRLIGDAFAEFVSKRPLLTASEKQRRI